MNKRLANTWIAYVLYIINIDDRQNFSILSFELFVKFSRKVSVWCLLELRPVTLLRKVVDKKDYRLTNERVMFIPP